MTRPSPKPRPTPKAKLGVTTLKSPSERLTGQPDKPAEKSVPQHQITHAGATFLRAETPIGFEAAAYIKTGVDLAPVFEQVADDSGGAA